MTPLDTSPIAEELQLKIIRNMTPGQRLKVALELSDLAQQFAFAGIEADFPGISKADLIRKYLVRLERTGCRIGHR